MAIALRQPLGHNEAGTAAAAFLSLLAAARDSLSPSLPLRQCAKEPS